MLAIFEGGEMVSLELKAFPLSKSRLLFKYDWNSSLILLSAAPLWFAVQTFRDAIYKRRT